MKHSILNFLIIVSALVAKICAYAVPAGIVLSRIISSYQWTGWTVTRTLLEAIILYFAFSYLAAFLVTLFKHVS